MVILSCMRAQSVQLCLTLCELLDCRPSMGSAVHGLRRPWAPPGKNTGVRCHGLLQGIFPTQGLNLHLICRLHWLVGFLPLAPPRVCNTFFYSLS